MLMAEVQMEDWLRSKGLGRFKDHFIEFGIESIHDLLDGDIVSDKELSGEIGMNQLEIRNFRKAVDENKICDWDIPEAVLARNEEAKNQDTSVYEYALFARKMKGAMYFMRLDHKGKKRRCSVKLCKRHKSFIFSYGTKPIEMTFKALRGVTELVDPETGDTKHPELLDLMDQDEADLCFLLTFSFEDDEAGVNSSFSKKNDDDSGDAPIQGAAMLNTSFNFMNRTLIDRTDRNDEEEELRPLNKRRNKQSSTVSFANDDKRGSDGALLPRKSKAASIKSFSGRHAKQKEKAHQVFHSIALGDTVDDEEDFENSGPQEKSVTKTKHIKKAVTVSHRGMMVLVLLCRSEEDLRFAVAGFRHAAEHAKELSQKTRAEEFEDELEHLSDLCAKEFEGTLKSLHYFHHLYRPHHHHNHPPLRFHNGILAEVCYDPSYEIVTYDHKSKKTMNRMKMPSAQFMRGMYLRARITGYDKDEETYDMEYVDGPYFGTKEPNGEVHFKLPVGSRSHYKFTLSGVKDTFLIVDLETTYGTHLPFVVLLITILQITFFIQYVVDHPEETVSMSSPVAGSDSWVMKIISDYPHCNDLRGQVYRIISHQFVFAGYISLFYNIILQTIFGLPLNMVHGHLRFFMLYEMGVIAGALCFVAVGGGQGQMLGSSGGVYSIVGMHLAEILIKWDLDAKGVMNHWIRLMVLATFIGIDLIIYNFAQYEQTSLTSHGGGLAMGIFLGVVMLDNPEVGWWERYILFPVTRVVASMLLVWSIAVYIFSYPPTTFLITTLTPCCWQIISCDNIKPSNYDQLECVEGIQLSEIGKDNFPDTCNQFTYLINERLGISNDDFST